MQDYIDSLLKVLPTLHEDSTKLKILNRITFAYSEIRPDEGLRYGQEALSLAEQLKSKKWIVDAMNNLGENYHKKGDYVKSLGYFLRALEIAKAIEYKKMVASVTVNVGVVYYEQGNYTKALDYFFSALKASEAEGDKQGIGRAATNIGNIYYDQGDLQKTLEYFLKALKIDEELGDKNGQAIDIGNIGNVYDDMGDYTQALDYMFRALKIDETIGNKNDVANVTGNIGQLFMHKKSYKMAIVYQLKALKMDEDIGNKRQVDYVLMGLGEAYLAYAEDSGAQPNKTGSKNNQNGYAPVLDAGLLRGIFPAGKVARLMLAIKYTQRGLELAQQLNILDLIKNGYLHLARAYTLKGDYKQALESFQDYTVIKDSVYSKSYENKLATMESKYELEKKQNRISLLEKDNQLGIVKIKQQVFQRNTIIFSSLLLVALIVASFLGWIQRNTKELQIAFSRSLLQSQEIERQRISRELHDSVGQNILFIKNQLGTQQNYTGNTQLIEAVDTAIDEVRNISKELYPNQLEKYGLAAAVDGLAEKATASTGIFVSADLHEIEHVVDKHISINLFRIIQESLNNAIKHSGAKAIRITGNLDNRNIMLVIMDNGKGFDKGILERKANSSFGLLNIEERAKMLGGKMELETGATGTTISIMIPV